MNWYTPQNHRSFISNHYVIYANGLDYNPNYWGSVWDEEDDPKTVSYPNTIALRQWSAEQGRIANGISFDRNQTQWNTLYKRLEAIYQRSYQTEADYIRDYIMEVEDGKRQSALGTDALREVKSTYKDKGGHSLAFTLITRAIGNKKYADLERELQDVNQKKAGLPPEEASKVRANQTMLKTNRAFQMEKNITDSVRKQILSLLSVNNYEDQPEPIVNVTSFQNPVSLDEMITKYYTNRFGKVSQEYMDAMLKQLQPFKHSLAVAIAKELLKSPLFADRKEDIEADIDKFIVSPIVDYMHSGITKEKNSKKRAKKGYQISKVAGGKNKTMNIHSIIGDLLEDRVLQGIPSEIELAITMNKAVKGRGIAVATGKATNARRKSQKADVVAFDYTGIYDLSKDIMDIYNDMDINALTTEGLNKMATQIRAKEVQHNAGNEWVRSKVYVIETSLKNYWSNNAIQIDSSDNNPTNQMQRIEEILMGTEPGNGLKSGILGWGNMYSKLLFYMNNMTEGAVLAGQEGEFTQMFETLMASAVLPMAWDNIVSETQEIPGVGVNHIHLFNFGGTVVTFSDVVLSLMKMIEEQSYDVNTSLVRVNFTPGSLPGGPDFFHMYLQHQYPISFGMDEELAKTQLEQRWVELRNQVQASSSMSWKLNQTALTQMLDVTKHLITHQ